MEKKIWTLLDVENNEYVDYFEIKEGHATLVKRRLQGGVQDGVDVIEVNNGVLNFTVLPTRGMGIWRGNCSGIDLTWNSPVRGPVHPGHVPYTEPSGFGWLHGFDEWLVRCGLESNGSPQFDDKGCLEYPLHGRIANIPASRVTVAYDPATKEFRIEGVVRESRVFGKNLELKVTYITKIDEPGFRCIDCVTNHSAEPSGIQLLYHINTGQPFATPGARAVVPYVRMAPRTKAAEENLPTWNILDPEMPGSSEVVFFFEPVSASDGKTSALLVNKEGTRAIELRFDTKQLPCFSFWKSRLSNKDAYVTGMEPAINFPNERRFEEKQGRVMLLESGETRTFELGFSFLSDKENIVKAEQIIRQLHATSPGKMVMPDAVGWGPGF